MQGKNIVYRYGNGHSYNLKCEGAGLSYRDLSGSEPDIWLGPFQYNSTEIESGVYFLAWHEESRGDYVTLLINFNKGQINSSAIVANKDTYFTHAHIVNES